MENEDVIKTIENEELDSRDRSRALEFLASVDIPDAHTILRKYLNSIDPLMRESAAVGSLAHINFRLYNTLLERLKREDELPSVKETISLTLDAWKEQWPDDVERLEKMRDRVLKGSNTVELIEYSGSDLGHALSAWTSTSRQLSDEKRARMPKLLQRLAKEGHHTPFEKSYMRFLVTVDMATHIHLLKHRIGVSVNGESARYKELKDDKFYVPADFPNDAELELYIIHMEESLQKYHAAIERYVVSGISKKRAKDLARFYIPYGNQIMLDISFNFRSFMHLQGLRNTEHAQQEVCNLSKMMLKAVRETEQFNESLKAFGWDEEKIYG